MTSYVFVWRWRFWLVVTVHIVLQERRVVTTKKNSLHFRKVSPPIRSKSIRTWNEKGKSSSNYGIFVSTNHWLKQLTKTSFTFSFYTLSVYIETPWFSQSPRWYWVVSWLWSRFSDPDCKRSRPGNDKKFPRNSSDRSEFVVVSKTTVLEQSSSASSSYPQTARNPWIEGWSSFKRRCTRRLGHKRVSGVCWSGRCWILLGKWSAACGRCF